MPSSARASAEGKPGQEARRFMTAGQGPRRPLPATFERTIQQRLRRRVMDDPLGVMPKVRCRQRAVRRVKRPTSGVGVRS
jgi:hypothetical protein